MAYIYEVNGQQVEFEKEPTDADIDEAARSLGAPQQSTKQPSIGVEPQAASIGGRLAAAVPEAVGAGVDMAKPAIQMAGQALGNYAKNPMNMLADVALTHAGAGPVMAGKKLYDTYQTAKQVASTVGNALTEVPEALRAPFKQVLDQMNPKDFKELSNLVKTQGRAALNNYRLPDYLASNPEAVNVFNEVKSAANPSMMSKVGKAMAPLASLGRGIGSALVQGAVAPESMALAPYQMAAYEQEKIRENPNAPGLESNPYAQTVRGEAATQNQAGAGNTQRALIGQQYGGLSPQEQAIMQQERQRQMMQQQKQQKAKTVLAQPPTPQNYMERMEAMATIYGRVRN